MSDRSLSLVAANPDSGGPLVRHPPEPSRSFIAAHTTAVQLPDGTHVWLRPVVPSDRALFVAAFEELSPESRYRRFFSPVHELSPEALDYLTRIDYHDHFAWVAVTKGIDGDRLIGVGRYVRTGDRRAAEAAVTVVDHYQGRGLGHLLLAALVLEALDHGFTTFAGEVLADNHAMQAVLSRAGARLESSDAGILGFEIDLPDRADTLGDSAPAEVLRAVARGEADIYGRVEPPTGTARR